MWRQHLAALGFAGVVLCIALAMDTTGSETSLAEEMGVTVILTEEGDERNCGGMAAETGMGGCFYPETPDIIYISKALPPEGRYHVTLHELGHVQLHRDGATQSECAADLFAAKHGSPEEPDC